MRQAKGCPATIGDGKNWGKRKKDGSRVDGDDSGFTHCFSDRVGDLESVGAAIFPNDSSKIE